MSNSIETIVGASSIEDLKALIKKAEGAIAEKKSGEILAAREQMFKMAETFDMTPQEILDFSVRKRRAPGVPKYRNPANPEQTWTGRGKKPGWLRDAADQEALRIPV
ncbi:MAG: H-NS histone family protein [Candidatus Contendobacter sp.]|nr:H-NS histone family protein [Gammaproteobacteria bacterium]MCC8993730.1 H-NS histone family protein [Candidatus Contendobacter sp.]